MRSVNKVFLLGTIGQDPKIVDVGTTRVAKLSLVTNRSYKSKKTDEWVEDASWHNIEMWGKLADWAEKYVIKGSRLHVEGELNYQEWEDKDGNKRKTTVVKVFSPPVFAGGKKREAAPESSPHGYAPEGVHPAPSAAPNPYNTDEAPPF